jgi:flagellar protein FlgJ
MPEPIAIAAPVPVHGAPLTASTKAAREFESVLAGQLVKQMFESMPRSDAFGGGPGEDIYRGMLAERVGDMIGRNGGIGIAKSVETEIARMARQYP